MLQWCRQTSSAAVVLTWFLLVSCTRSFLSPDASARSHHFASRRRKHHQEQLQLSINEGEQEISVGIDLGTTFSAIAYLDEASSLPRIVPIPNNGRTLPSVVAFDAAADGGEMLVGQEAIQLESETGQSSYRNVKRVIGTGGKIKEAVASVVPFLVPNQGQGKTFRKDSLTNQLHDAEEFPTLLQDTRDFSKTLRPDYISSRVLRCLQTAASLHTGCKVTKAVIGVPAYFTDMQKEATKQAADLCDIQKIKLIPEPEAAALAYGVGKRQIGQDGSDELVLVFDLGGGTYDVSMLAVGGGVTEILFTSGNAQLGGTAFDAKIAQHLTRVLKKDQGVSTKRWSVQARKNIVLVGEAVRIHLSNNRRVQLVLPIDEGVWEKMEDPSAVVLSSSDEDSAEQVAPTSKHVLHTLDRNQMESICAEEFQALIRPLREVAIMSGAMLAGDASPSTVSAALAMEENEKQDDLSFLDFYEIEEDSSSVVPEKEATEEKILMDLGEIDVKAAKKAQQGGRKRARNLAKNERRYRAEKRKLEQPGKAERGKVRDGITGRPISRIVLVGGATRMPTIGRLLTQLTGVVPQRTVNPDEAVALGCAVHAGILDGSDDGTGEMLLNPMKAAILRAVAQREGFGNNDELDDEMEGLVEEEIII